MQKITYVIVCSKLRQRAYKDIYEMKSIKL